MSAQKGSKAVVALVAATIGVLGVSTVYLPFYADKSALRGMNEGSFQGEQSEQEHDEEIERFIRQFQREQDDKSELESAKKGNSMWKRMWDASKSGK